MKLFEVTRWGNDVDGGDGPDTNYLVVARDHEEAASLVRPRERNLDAITELGDCLAEVERPVVLRGPYIEHKLDPGTNFLLWSWDGYELETWIPTPRCRDGEATCHHANGQLAARYSWSNHRQHGVYEAWYPDGRLMQRGERRQGKLVGVHESWYADGTPASRLEYISGGVRYQRWDRDGRLVEEGVEDWNNPEA